MERGTRTYHQASFLPPQGSSLMHTALRYLLLGALVASVVSLWSPPWYVMVIAFWCGRVVGLVTGFAVFLADMVVAKYLPD